MTVADLYLPKISWLHRVDARVKLLLTAALILLLLLLQNLPLMMAALLVSLALHLSAGVSLRRLRRVAVGLLPVSLLMFLLRTIFYPQGATLIAVGPLTLTSLGLASGAVVGFRIVAMALVVLLWLYTTRSRDVVRSLVSLGLPFSWGLSFSLALRYLPEFAHTYQIVEQAQQSRGLDLSRARWLDRVRWRMPIFIAMLISTLRRSEQMAIALEARAYDSHGTVRSDLEPLEFRPLDGVLASLVVGLLLASVFAHLRYHFGSHPWRLIP